MTMYAVRNFDYLSRGKERKVSFVSGDRRTILYLDEDAYRLYDTHKESTPIKTWLEIPWNEEGEIFIEERGYEGVWKREEEGYTLNCALPYRKVFQVSEDT